MNAIATTDAIEFYRTHRWVVRDAFTDRILAYFATEALARTDMEQRFGWNYEVAYLDDAETQAAVEGELGLLAWGPVKLIDGTEVDEDLVRDSRRGLITWDEVRVQHRVRAARKIPA